MSAITTLRKEFANLQAMLGVDVAAWNDGQGVREVDIFQDKVDLVFLVLAYPHDRRVARHLES